MLKRGTLLLLWGLTLLWSFHSRRLDLLLRGVFHGLVGVTGLVLLMLGVALLLKREKQAERWRWPWLLSGVMAALVLVLPASPSFSDLASNRPQGLPDPPELAFVLPPNNAASRNGCACCAASPTLILWPAIQSASAVSSGGNPRAHR